MSSGSENPGEHANDDMSRTVMMMDPEYSHGGGCCFYGGGWAARGWRKMREWSEVVAGPRWKTFIRRFGRNKASGGQAGQGKFGYDACSYALNFDDRQNGQFNEEEDLVGPRDFSARFASAMPVSAKSSMDLGRDGPSFT